MSSIGANTSCQRRKGAGAHAQARVDSSGHQTSEHHHGQAKLADIGLVAEQSEAKSFVGTEGFIPSEGPGAPQADIYSLGKVLYEIATGKDRHEFPALPTLLGDNTSDTHLLELNSVFLKACQNDLKHRYRTCEEMRDDLVLLQSGKSVKRSQEVERRLRKLTQASVVGVTVTLMTIAALSYAKNQERKTQLHAKREAALRQRAEQSELEAQRNLYSADMLSAQQAFESSNLGRAMELLEMHRPRQGAPDLRGWEWRYLWGRCQGEELLTLAGHPVGVLSVAFSPDGNRLASGDHDGNVKVWDLGFAPEGPGRWSANGSSVSLDGQQLITTSFERSVAVWDVNTRRKIVEFKAHDQHVDYTAFSHDGKLLATVGGDGLAKVWDWRAQKEIATFRGTLNALFGVAFSLDDRRLAVGSYERAEVWDLATHREVDQPRGNTNWVLVVNFLDENTLFAASWREAIIWRAPTFSEIETTETANGQK